MIVLVGITNKLFWPLEITVQRVNWTDSDCAPWRRHLARLEIRSTDLTAPAGKPGAPPECARVNSHGRIRIAPAVAQLYHRMMFKFTTCLLFSVLLVVRASAVDPVPEGMKGISGLISARMIEKDNERGTIVMRVEKVHRLWRGNKAKNAHSGEGKTLKLTGITGKALDQLLVINKGDRFSIEIKHVSGPNLRYLGEGLKRLNEGERPAEALSEDSNPRRFMHGFRGIFIGRLTAKDAEKGTLSVKIESIKRTWKKNKARQAAKARGQVWEVRGVSGKWLDVLVESKIGERLEVEAFHNRGNKLDFVGEWLKKAE